MSNWRKIPSGRSLLKEYVKDCVGQLSLAKLAVICIHFKTAPWSFPSAHFSGFQEELPNPKDINRNVMIITYDDEEHQNQHELTVKSDDANP